MIFRPRRWDDYKWCYGDDFRSIYKPLFYQLLELIFNTIFKWILGVIFESIFNNIFRLLFGVPFRVLEVEKLWEFFCFLASSLSSWWFCFLVIIKKMSEKLFVWYCHLWDSTFVLELCSLELSFLFLSFAYVIILLFTIWY
jgi:hypothetical protein